MRRTRVYLVCLAIAILVGLYSVKSKAFPDGGNSNTSVIEGQIFVVKLVPAAKRIEVLVTGKQVASLESSKIGLTASLQLPNRTIMIPARRKNDRFELESIPVHNADSTLRVRVKSGETEEVFDFQIPMTHP